MKKYFLFTALLFSLFIQRSFAQDGFPEFGFYSEEEINMKGSAFEKDAEAIILLDQAFAHYDEDYHLITERRVRIKILNQRGLDRASIRIPFYIRDAFENIKGIEGMTFTPNENAATKLSKKSIFTEKLDDKFSIIKFAMPNVKVGSIIEYKYTSIMKHYGGLDHWVFQSDIPTIKSSYKLEVLPNTDFSYLLLKKREYPVKITPPSEGVVLFEMNNLPGLQYEPYMDAPKDYLQRVEFKLSSLTHDNTGLQETFDNSWQELAKRLMEDEDFGIAVNKKIPIPDELRSLADTASTALSKVAIIYNYVKDHFNWNEYDGKYSIDGLKKILDTRTGNSGELNLLLVNFLRAFKIDAKPLLVAERSFGRVLPEYVFIDRFNKTDACVMLNGKLLVLDVTEKYSSITLVPYELLNTNALVVDKNTRELIEIGSSGQLFKQTVQIRAKIDPSGLLNGSCVIYDHGYAKASQIADIKNDKESGFVNNYESSYEGIKIGDFVYDYPDKDSLPLTERFSISREIDNNGGFALLNYNLFTGLTKNPFTSDVRFTNINFGYPYTVVVEETIELPDNATTETVTKDITLEKFNGAISLTRSLKKVGKSLNIKIVFDQKISLFGADNYPDLKAIYKSMVDLLNEPVVIKL